MTEKLPWFPFFVNDFLSSSKVALMTTEEIGAYTLLLCHAWNDPHGSVPNDDDKLRKLGKISGDISRLRACFSVKKSRLVNRRLVDELKNGKRIQRLRAEFGKKGGLAKATAIATTKALAKLKQSPTQSQSQSQSQSQEESDKTKKEKSKKIPLDTSTHVSSAKGGLTWERYRVAYHETYGADPIRNKTTNCHLAKLVEKLGAEKAPEIAAFYLEVKKLIYTQNRHPTNLLIRDAEGLHTQWITGVKATSGEARNVEARDNDREQIKRVEAILKGGGV